MSFYQKQCFPPNQPYTPIIYQYAKEDNGGRGQDLQKEGRKVNGMGSGGKHLSYKYIRLTAVLK